MMNTMTNSNQIGTWKASATWNKNNRWATDERYKNRFNSLGIPVDNLSLNEAVDAIFQLVEDYRKDQEPKLVATLNVDFLVNSLGYSFAKPRHPELFEVLRGADLITADGFPIVLLSKIAGFPLKERVTGADLAPELARVAVERGKSIYLLGGGGNTADLAAEMLQKNNPGLKIAGTSAPMVAIDGESLASWEEDDRATVEAINASGADILLMAFGNPKQELWFSRNKHRLQVPVSIGVGGTFAFITGQVKRAPIWVQKSNMEWIFRMIQDPKRLFKRYAIGVMKFGFLTFPLLLQRAQRKLGRLVRFFDVQESGQICFDWKVHWASKDDVLKMLRLPKSLSRQHLEQLVTELKSHNQPESITHTYMIDFSKVDQLSMAANEAFCELAKLFKSGHLNGLLIGMSDKLIKRLKAARVMDMAASSAVSVEQMQDAIMAKNHRRGSAEIKSYAVGNTCLNYFSGAITGEILASHAFEDCMQHTAEERRIIIDLRRVTAIDSAAIAALYRLARSQSQQDPEHIQFSGMTECIQQMIKVVGMASAFHCIDDEQFYDQLFEQSAC